MERKGKEQLRASRRRQQADTFVLNLEGVLPELDSINRTGIEESDGVDDDDDDLFNYFGWVLFC